MKNINRLYEAKFGPKKKEVAQKGKAPAIIIHGKFNEAREANDSIYKNLLKKSEQSGIDIDILGEVYDRGCNAWLYAESTKEYTQYAFDRVNSFINQGRSYFEEDADLVEAKPDFRYQEWPGQKAKKAFNLSKYLENSEKKQGKSETAEKKISEDVENLHTDLVKAGALHAKGMSRDNRDYYNAYLDHNKVADVLKKHGYKPQNNYTDFKHANGSHVQLTHGLNGKANRVSHISVNYKGVNEEVVSEVREYAGYHDDPKSKGKPIHFIATSFNYKHLIKPKTNLGTTNKEIYKDLDKLHRAAKPHYGGADSNDSNDGVMKWGWSFASKEEADKHAKKVHDIFVKNGVEHSPFHYQTKNVKKPVSEATVTHKSGRLHTVARGTGDHDVYWDGHKTHLMIFNGSVGISGRGKNNYGIYNRSKKTYVKVKGSLADMKRKCENHFEKSPPPKLTEDVDPYKQGYDAWKDYVTGKTKRYPSNPYKSNTHPGHVHKWERGAEAAYNAHSSDSRGSPRLTESTLSSTHPVGSARYVRGLSAKNPTKVQKVYVVGHTKAGRVLIHKSRPGTTAHWNSPDSHYEVDANQLLKSLPESVENIAEKHLTPNELKKREEIAQAMGREHPNMNKGKKMAIATAVAKRVAEENIDEVSKSTLSSYIRNGIDSLVDLEKQYHYDHGFSKDMTMQDMQRRKNRSRFIKKAVRRLANEENIAEVSDELLNRASAAAHGKSMDALQSKNLPLSIKKSKQAGHFTRAHMRKVWGEDTRKDIELVAREGERKDIANVSRPDTDPSALAKQASIKSKILETVKSSDKQPVIIPAHYVQRDPTKPPILIPAKAIMKKVNKVIINPGDNPNDGK